ncbi:MAG: hypothetical protein ING36_15315 [Burkholderiales bacterium]|nr:hypothetical protein [Burkholderiales bacterium]
MATYVADIYSHLRTIQQWTNKYRAKANINFSTFQMEIIANHRHYVFYPRFMSGTNQGQRYYTDFPIEDTSGFIGWLPYRPLNFDLSDNKLAFKEFMQQAGFLTPRCWSSYNEINAGFIIKGQNGSFGAEIAGPFRVQKNFSMPQTEKVFFEQFVQGNIIKIWCWSDKPFFSHKHTYPVVYGDGKSSLHTLIDQRLFLFGSKYEIINSQKIIEACIQFQGYELNTILPPAIPVWIDFRYGYSHFAFARAAIDALAAEELNRCFSYENALPKYSQKIADQINSVVKTCSEYLQKKYPAPILFALDACIDDAEQVWWLEINSNPSLPPVGYNLIFSDLFGTA